jgi:hypothetical protein
MASNFTARESIVKNAIEINDKSVLAHSLVSAAIKITLPFGTTAMLKAVNYPRGHLKLLKKVMKKFMFQHQNQNYLQITDNKKLILIDEFPIYIHDAFKGAKYLNCI